MYVVTLHAVHGRRAARPPKGAPQFVRSHRGQAADALLRYVGWRRAGDTAQAATRNVGEFGGRQLIWAVELHGGETLLQFSVN